MDRDGNADRETTAGVRCCQLCTLTVTVAVAATITTVVMAVVLCLVLFSLTAPDVGQTSSPAGAELVEQLQQCQREQQDLDLMLHAVTRDSRCQLCPKGWLWWRSRCYFFSVGQQDRQDRRWNESVEFCQQHGSNLAVIENPAEMDFLQGVMRGFPQFPFLWVGLSDAAQEGRWLWWNGMDVQHYMPLTVEWDADHRDCADLRGSGSLFAADCEAYGPWACKKDS